MKQVSFVILCLCASSVFSDANSVVSQQISNQIARTTAEAISRNMGYYVKPSRDIRGVSPVQENSFFNYQQERDFSNDGESFSVPPIYPSPNVSEFRR